MELLKMRARGDMSEEDYRLVLTATDTDIRAASNIHEDAVLKRDSLAPLDDVYETIARGTPDDMSPGEWNAMLSKIIDRIEVSKDQVVIYPHRGDAATYQRTRSGMVPA